jgi:hypothetical protein
MAKVQSQPEEKKSAYLGITCYPSELKRWRKAFLETREDNMSRKVRKILNREADILGAELIRP